MTAPRVGFVFIGYDQFVELEWTADLIKNKWKQFEKSPIVAVLSGDPGKNCDDTDIDELIHVPNIVEVSLDYMREHFDPNTYDASPGIGAAHFRSPANGKVNNTLTASMIRNYKVGFEALNKFSQPPDVVLVCESNILLLDPDGITLLAHRLLNSSKQIAAQLVGGYDDPVVKWTGQEILPQVFMVNWDFCCDTGFMFDLKNTRPDCPEMVLKDNLLKHGKFEDLVLNGGNRVQWGVHLGNPRWFNFAHLDRPPGADTNGGVGWESREKQLEIEEAVMKRFGCV